MITVTVPATSANVGAGFDSLGLAVSMYNVFTFEEADRIQITSVDGAHIPTGSNNLVYRSARVVYDQLGIPMKGLRITQKNTIYGTRFVELPDVKAPLVADASSMILSEPMDVNRYGVIYAGAQKNIGPSGLCVVIVRKDLLGHAKPICPKLMDWKVEADKGSMYNTPNTWGIYLAGLTFDWLLSIGGVEAIYQVNQEKAKLLYDFLDNSKLFKATAQKKYRSLMNVTFVTGDAEKDAAFVKAAAAQGLVNLKGHRTVGGMRASIYNAMPMEGVKKLVEFMKEFERANA